MNNNDLFTNKRFLIIFGIVIAALALLAFGLSFLTKDLVNGPKTTVATQDSLQYPMAIFSGKISDEFFNNVSSSNYSATRLIVGDFLVNKEQIKLKKESTNAPNCEILSYSSDFGDNSTYLVTIEFKSLDNGKKYKAQIVNYMDNSQSSYIKIIDYNYQKTFANNLQLSKRDDVGGLVEVFYGYVCVCGGYKGLVGVQEAHKGMPALAIEFAKNVIQ